MARPEQRRCAQAGRVIRELSRNGACRKTVAKATAPRRRGSSADAGFYFFRFGFSRWLSAAGGHRRNCRSMRRLREDSMVPSALENDPAPWFFPSLADADGIGGAPLLAGL